MTISVEETFDGMYEYQNRELLPSSKHDLG
jgi:hypothetical protein